METLRQCASALSQWAYTIYSVQVPLLNISFWMLALSLLAFRMLLKAMDPVTHRNQSGGQDQNNNRVYREEQR